MTAENNNNNSDNIFRFIKQLSDIRIDGEMVPVQAVNFPRVYVRFEILQGALLSNAWEGYMTVKRSETKHNFYLHEVHRRPYKFVYMTGNPEPRGKVEVRYIDVAERKPMNPFEGAIGKTVSSVRPYYLSKRDEELEFPCIVSIAFEGSDFAYDIGSDSSGVVVRRKLKAANSPVETSQDRKENRHSRTARKN